MAIDPSAGANSDNKEMVRKVTWPPTICWGWFGSTLASGGIDHNRVGEHNENNAGSQV